MGELAKGAMPNLGSERRMSPLEPPQLDISLGACSDGSTVAVRRGDTPALLVTGTTGSGKSAFVKTMAAALIRRCAPQELRYAIFDSSRVGYRCLTSIPHMFYPTARDPEEFERLAGVVSTESERRLRLLARRGRSDVEH